jgi:hypothetical protein
MASKKSRERRQKRSHKRFESDKATTATSRDLFTESGLPETPDTPSLIDNVQLAMWVRTTTHSCHQLSIS